MPAPRREEQTKTLTRLRGAIKIKASPDVTDILGLDSGLADVGAVDDTEGSNSVTQILSGESVEVGSIESLDIVQARESTVRYAFNANPQQGFQVVPRNHKVSLKATRVVLKKLGRAEKVFNFMPSNLVFQQIPFIIQVDDIGDPTDETTRVTHIFYGCWFVNSTVKYDVTSDQDQRLIQNVDIVCSRVLTLDGSDAGSGGATTARAVFSGIGSTETAQTVLKNVPLA